MRRSPEWPLIFMGSLCLIVTLIFTGLIVTFYFTWYQPATQYKYGLCNANCSTLNYSDCSTIGNPQTCVLINIKFTLFDTNFTGRVIQEYYVNQVLTQMPNCSSFISGYPSLQCSYRLKIYLNL